MSRTTIVKPAQAGGIGSTSRIGAVTRTPALRDAHSKRDVRATVCEGCVAYK
jgi:hypothetical protein